MYHVPDIETKHRHRLKTKAQILEPSRTAHSLNARTLSFVDLSVQSYIIKA